MNDKNHQMTEQEMLNAIEEQTPCWLRVWESRGEAIELVETEIARLNLTDTESIYKKAVHPLITERGAGWRLLESIIHCYCNDWSEDKVQEVVAPVRKKQEAEWAIEDAEYERCLAETRGNLAAEVII